MYRGRDLPAVVSMATLCFVFRKTHGGSSSNFECDLELNSCHRRKILVISSGVFMSHGWFSKGQHASKSQIFILFPRHLHQGGNMYAVVVPNCPIPSPGVWDYGVYILRKSTTRISMIEGMDWCFVPWRVRCDVMWREAEDHTSLFWQIDIDRLRWYQLVLLAE